MSHQASQSTARLSGRNKKGAPTTWVPPSSSSSSSGSSGATPGRQLPALPAIIRDQFYDPSVIHSPSGDFTIPPGSSTPKHPASPSTSLGGPTPKHARASHNWADEDN